MQKLFIQGGKGSGDLGHKGRKGQIGGSAKGYISKIQKRSDTMVNPFNPRVTSFLTELGDDVKANIELSDHTSFRGEPAVYFNITVPTDNRGKGFVTEFMKELINEADAAGVSLVGEPEAFGSGKKMSTKQLWKWYQSLGFEKEGDLVVYHPTKTLRLGSGKTVFHFGGSGSGNFDHAGRPGQVGGSRDDNKKGKDKMRIVHHGTSLEAVKKIKTEGLKKKIAPIGDRPASVYFMNSFQQTKEYVEELHLDQGKGYAIVSFSIPNNVSIIEDEEEGDSYRIEVDIPANLIHSITYYDSSNNRIHQQRSKIGYSIVIFPLEKV